MQQETLETLDTSTGPRETQKPKPVELRTARDYTLTTQAIEARVDDLKKLAKKNQDEGYTREGKNISGDAAALEHFILPQFRSQGEMPLRTPQQVRSGIVAALGVAIRGKLIVRVNKEEDAPVSVSNRESELANEIATRVMAFGEELFEEAYNAGLAAREQSFEMFALRSMSAMYGSDDV